VDEDLKISMRDFDNFLDFSSLPRLLVERVGRSGPGTEPFDAGMDARAMQ
jgi:hypothetical protein